MVDRMALLKHVDWLLRPPPFVYDQLERAIEHAAAGRANEVVEIDCRHYTAAEAVELWELEELVERARTGDWSDDW